MWPTISVLSDSKLFAKPRATWIWRWGSPNSGHWLRNSGYRWPNVPWRRLERVRGGSIQRAHVLYLTGQAYRVMNRYHEAVPPLTAAAELDPENIFIWLALAWCYKRISRLDLAIEALESALAADEREAILHYNLACYWSLAGNPTIALQYLAQSFDIDPNFRDLVADEVDFDPIRELPDFQSLVGVIV